MITLYQQPSQFSPAFNEQVFLCLSDKRTQDNFRYVFDIYFTGSSTYDARLKIAPNSSGYGLLDSRRIIENYSSYDISVPDTDAFKRNANSYKGYTVKFGEEFGLSTTGTTVYSNLLTSSTFYGYNAIFDHVGFKDYSQTDYLITSGTTKSFLTNAPSSQSIRASQNAWLHMMTNEVNAVHRMKIVTTDSVLGTGTSLINNAYRALSSEGDRFLRFPVGTYNLNQIDNSHFDSGSQDIILSTTTSYTVTIVNSAGVACSETITFNVDTSCTNYTVYRLHFLNALGGFDSFNFLRLSRINHSNEMVKSKRVIGSQSGTTWAYNKIDRSNVVHYNKGKTKIFVASDWISEAQATWLRELVESPEVYWEKSTTELIPVNILTSNYEEKKVVNDKMFNLELEFEYSHDNYRQRL